MTILKKSIMVNKKYILYRTKMHLQLIRLPYFLTSQMFDHFYANNCLLLLLHSIVIELDFNITAKPFNRNKI